MLGKEVSANNWVVSKKSEVKKITLNPTWEPFKMSVNELCISGNMNSTIRCMINDWDQFSNDDLIGEFYCTANELFFDKADLDPKNPNFNNLSSFFLCFFFKKKPKTLNFSAFPLRTTT